MLPERFGPVLDARPLHVGMSGAPVHLVTTAAGTFVVKHHPHPRAVEMQALAAAHGVAPAVRHVAGLETVSDHVAGSFLQAFAADRGAALASLAAQLAALRAIPTDGLPAFDLPPMATALWAGLVARPGFPAWALPLAARLPALLDAWSAEPVRVFAHADLNPGNVLWDGARAWLVGWERAELAHPLLDLATFSTFLRLADDEALALQPGADRAAFQDVRALVRLVYGAMFLSRVPDLAATSPDLDATPDLAQAYARLAAGEPALGSPAGQAMMGAAMLKEALAHA